MADNPTREELDDIIAEHQPRLKSFISQRVRSTKDAEDILQDVLYQFVKTVNDSVTPIGHISAWLYRVAHNTIINAGIRKKEELLPYYTDDEGETYLPEGFLDIMSGDEAAPSPETEYLRSLVWVELEEALAELPPEQCEIFELTELDGIPVKEISAASGVSVNTLLSRKHYAVVHLRKRLSDLYDDIIGS